MLYMYVKNETLKESINKLLCIKFLRRVYLPCSSKNIFLVTHIQYINMCTCVYIVYVYTCAYDRSVCICTHTYIYLHVIYFNK